ncbi:MAG TPA: glycosyltransferase family 8 protein [Smithella sp.]|nr:glycosyltransferase family 8 protein [Smithella sp.]
MTKISVVFICDSNFVIPTAVAITSMICNKNKDTHYAIYIIAAELSEDEIEKLCKFRGRDIDICIIKASLKNFEGVRQFAHVTLAACLKFDLPNLIPDVDKALYVDGDVIIQKDLKDLFEININDYYAGAVQDIICIDNDFGVNNYFNSGVMLLNLKRLRADDTSSALLEIRKSKIKSTLMDQDCFNVLFDKKVKLLPVKYNCFYNFFVRRRNHYTLDSINKCFETNYASLDEMKADSFILHFIDFEKPWIYFNSALTSEWDEYFKKSPFRMYNLKRKSIKLRHFIASHHATNLLYWFLKYWHDHDFKFALNQARYYFADKKMTFKKDDKEPERI